MIAIMGKTVIDSSVLDKIQDSITKEFSYYLGYTLGASFGFIVLVTLLLSLFAGCFIAKKINDLTKQVNEATFKKDFGNYDDTSKMDEIEKLEFVFNKFYNEE
jgi:hypothetical protein